MNQQLPIGGHSGSVASENAKHDQLLATRHELPFVPIMALPNKSVAVFFNDTTPATVTIPDNALLMSISTVTDLNSGGVLYSFTGIPTLDTSASGAQADGVGLAVGQGVLFECQGLKSVSLRAVTAGYNTVVALQFWDRLV